MFGGIGDVLTRDAARQSVYAVLAVFIFAYAKQLHGGLAYMPHAGCTHKHTYTHTHVRVRELTHVSVRIHYK